MTSLAFAGAGWVTAVHGLAVDSLAPVAPTAELRVTRVASRTPEAARRRAAQVGARACRYDELPGGADVVVVAVPPALHLREARRAVEGGAGALVEAPLAATLADADEMVALAAGGARLAYGENLVHAPPVAEAVRAHRLIGALTYLDVHLAQGPPEQPAHRDASWGGGALFGLGTHAVALAQLLAAPARVVSVEATLGTGAGSPVDDDARVTLVFDSGLRASLRASWRAAAPTWHAQGASADGAARLELIPEPAVEVNGASLLVPMPPEGLASAQLHHMGYLAQLATVAADAREGRAPRSGAAFGRAVLDVVCAAYASAGTGRPEPVPFRGPRHLTPHELWTGAGGT